MTTLLLIRHGQTDFNAQKRWQGHLDVPLNEIGKQQARAIADRLATWPIEAVYSSDLKRAAMTAVPIAAAHQLIPIFEPIWRERDVGDFVGLTGTEAREKYPEVWDQMKHGLLNPPNGENSLALRERVVKAFTRLVARYEDQVIAVVSHGGTLANIIAHVLDIPPNKHGRFRLSGNTGLSIVEITDDRGPQLTLLNDTSHLDHLPSAVRQNQGTAEI